MANPGVKNACRKAEGTQKCMQMHVRFLAGPLDMLRRTVLITPSHQAKWGRVSFQRGSLAGDEQSCQGQLHWYQIFNSTSHAGITEHTRCRQLNEHAYAGMPVQTTIGSLYACQCGTSRGYEVKARKKKGMALAGCGRNTPCASCMRSQ